MYGKRRCVAEFRNEFTRKAEDESNPPEHLRLVQILLLYTVKPYALLRIAQLRDVAQVESDAPARLGERGRFPERGHERGGADVVHRPCFRSRGRQMFVA